MAEVGEDRGFALVYRLTRDDAAAYEDLPGELSTRAKVALLMPLVLLGASGGWLAGEFGLDKASWSTLKEWTVIGAVIAIWFVLATVGLSIARHRRVRRFPLPPGEVRLTMARDGVDYNDGAVMERYRWSHLPWVHQSRAHVFMKTDAHRVIIAPLPAFSDFEEMRRFAEFADASSRAASP